jgi:hypothetical protein
MELTIIPDTNYVILPDGTVARKLTPTPKKDGLYWFLHVGTPPKVVRFTDKEIADIEQVKKKIALNSAGIA